MVPVRGQRVAARVIAVRMGVYHGGHLFAPMAAAVQLFEQVAGAAAMRVVAVAGIHQYQVASAAEQGTVVADHDLACGVSLHFTLPYGRRYIRKKIAGGEGEGAIVEYRQLNAAHRNLLHWTSCQLQLLRWFAVTGSG